MAVCTPRTRLPSEVTMKNQLLSMIFVFVASACGAHDPNSCVVLCSTDADCPGDLTCGELGLCTSGETCPCTAGEFLGCADESSTRFCNATADGVEIASCGAPGCNADAGRCNTCVPGGA